MKAVVFHGVGDIRLDDVDEPELREDTDAIVRLTASAICGTDLHFVRGTVPGVEDGTILGHEGVGIIEEVGSEVRNLQRGDRVVIPATIACGNCVYCRAGYTAQCDEANPNGPAAGTAFYGGPATSGPFDGLQAERARIPHAAAGLVKLPDDVSDDAAILLSDIFPTAWFAAELADIECGKSVAVFGCGPVGQLVISSLKLMDAGRIFAIDHVPDRLEMARAQGAETINFDSEDPIEALRELTKGIGPDRAIDAVGVDAEKSRNGDGNWQPGDSPSLALQWCVDAVAKAGRVSIVGVYPEAVRFFPIGTAMNKNLTLRMGNCNHRKYIPKLLRLLQSHAVDPTPFLARKTPLASAIDAYEEFDKRSPHWVKVELLPVG